MMAAAAFYFATIGAALLNFGHSLGGIACVGLTIITIGGIAVAHRTGVTAVNIEAVISAITPHLREAQALTLDRCLKDISHGVANQHVRNKDFIDAKFFINNRVDEAVEAFLKTGPHEQKHTQSDWWLAAYKADALVSGTYQLSSALKRASKVGALKEYAAFLAAILPIAELLNSAKPFIVKRKPGDKSPERVAADIERDKHTMTCQCCARRIFAETGVIAHHGYERPDHGWQTASCFGARALPFEADRSRLGELIEVLKGTLERKRANRVRVVKEKQTIDRDLTDYSVAYHFGKDRPTIKLSFTRSTFDAVCAANEKLLSRNRPMTTFDALKKSEIAECDASIARTVSSLDFCQSRYDGWKRTHKWEGGEWVGV